MSRPFRFAVQGQHLDDHDRLVAEARNVEALGYDELFSYDHVGAVDPFIPLTVAAAATTGYGWAPWCSTTNSISQRCWPGLLRRSTD